MSMAEKEIAAGNDEQRSNETREPKIYETGYFLLSQQINSLRDSVDAKFETTRKEIKELAEKTDMKFDTVYKDIKALSDKTDARFDRFDAKFAEVHKEIKDLSDKTDARFEAARKEADARFDKLNDKVDGLQRWAIGSVIAVIVGTIGVIVTILLK